MDINTQKREYIAYITSYLVMIICSMSTMTINASVGRYFLGVEAVAVVNLVLPVTEIYFILLLLFGVSAIMATTLAVGRGDREAVSRHFTVSFTMVAAGSLLLSLLLLIFRDEVALFLAGDTSLQEQTHDYLSMMLPWFVIHNVFIIFELFTLVIGKVRYVLICSVVQFVVNIACSLLLMNLLEWGIGSFALSAAISVEVAAILLVYLHFKDDCPFVMLLMSWKEYLSTLRNGVKYGFAFLCTQTVYIIFAFMMNNIVLEHLGENFMLGWSTICLVFTIANYASVTGQMACIFLAGKYCAKGDKEGVDNVFKWSYIFVVGWNMLALVVAYLNTLIDVGYPTPLSLLLICAPFVIINNVMGVYSFRLLGKRMVGSFVGLYAAIYLPLPLLIMLLHNMWPGNEVMAFLALIPVQGVAYLLSKRRIKQII